MQIIDQYKAKIVELNNAKLQALSQLNDFKLKLQQSENENHNLKEMNEILKLENDKLIVENDNLKVSIEEMKYTNNNNINTMKSALDHISQEKNKLNLKIKQLQREMKDQYNKFINKYEMIKQERDKLLLKLGNNNNNGSNDTMNDMVEPPSQLTLNKINPSLSFYSQINTMYTSKISKYIIDLIAQIKPQMEPKLVESVGKSADTYQQVSRIGFHSKSEIKLYNSLFKKINENKNFGKSYPELKETGFYLRETFNNQDLVKKVKVCLSKKEYPADVIESLSQTAQRMEQKRRAPPKEVSSLFYQFLRDCKQYYVV